MISVRARILVPVLVMILLGDALISWLVLRDSHHEIEEVYDAQLAQSFRAWAASPQMGRPLHWLLRPGKAGPAPAWMGRAPQCSAPVLATAQDLVQLLGVPLEDLLWLAPDHGHWREPQGGCALFQWLSTEYAEELHEFMALRGILLRLFSSTSSLRFGLPGEEADWLRLDQAFEAFAREKR